VVRVLARLAMVAAFSRVTPFFKYAVIPGALKLRLATLVLNASRCGALAPSFIGAVCPSSSGDLNGHTEAANGLHLRGDGLQQKRLSGSFGRVVGFEGPDRGHYRP
jgi:hypothetical protein